MEHDLFVFELKTLKFHGIDNMDEQVHIFRTKRLSLGIFDVAGTPKKRLGI